MIFTSLTFVNPWLLTTLAILPILYFLLKLTPPSPRIQPFAPILFLQKLDSTQEEASKSPWWLIILRLLIITCIILALASPLYQLSPQGFLGKQSLLIVVDDRWSSAVNWEQRKNNVQDWIQNAQDEERNVTLVTLSQGQEADFSLQTAAEALGALETMKPKPTHGDIGGFIRAVEGKKDIYFNEFDTWVWFTNGLESEENDKIKNLMEKIKVENQIIFVPSKLNIMRIQDVQNKQEYMEISIDRIKQQYTQSGLLTAYDRKNRIIEQKEFVFGQNENKQIIKLKMPIEIRNELAYLDIQEHNLRQNQGNQTGRHAGEKYLLDHWNQRKKIGIITGGTQEDTQPLLSSIYFIQKAIEPFAQVQKTEINKENNIEQIIDNGINTLIIADVGTIQQNTKEKIQKWVENGGTLIRFAGPRLAANVTNVTNHQQELMPVTIRKGTRNLSSTLSWSTPQRLAKFSENSPFAGINVPEDVTVTKQVLAEPSIDLEQHVWARLEDRTPLVTAKQQNDGWIILFHIDAQPDWSTLPLSGVFVEMLQRIVALSYAPVQQRNNTENENDESDKNEQENLTTLAPVSVMDGFGRLGAPTDDTRSLAINAQGVAVPSQYNPPGFYGKEEGIVALNLFEGKNTEETLIPFNTNNIDSSWQVRELSSEQQVRFKTALLVVAFVLFLVDCIAVLYMAGLLQIRNFVFKTSTAILIITLLPLLYIFTSQAVAQEQDDASQPNIDFSASLETRIGYVITGNERIDNLSRKGMIGLTQFITARTALEPAEPRGVDIAKDELSFYPILYWPVSPNQRVPSTQTMARVDSFMKQGGSVLFDTQDYRAGAVWGEGTSAANLKLREILNHLDIPPVEPVPADHVLTRSFYLLNTFYGRFRGSELWVESPSGNNSGSRRSDGVSSVLITAGDFAGAWAVEPSGAYSLPISPPSPRQRTLAYRAGVNIIMYMLTGNYKTDQVHTPALLERLGQ